MFRVIPQLLLSGGELYKTTKFKNPKYIGDPINAIRIFNEKEVDEIIVTDISATKERLPPNFALIEDLAAECFMPMTYGGGIRSMKDVDLLFSCGIEKICIQSALANDYSLLRDISTKYGNQSLVVSLDFFKPLFGKLKIYNSAVHGKLKGSYKDLQFISNLEIEGVGEFLITSVDHEGCRNGMDIDLISAVAKKSSVPIIAAGGIGSFEDIRAASVAGASAVSVGTYFVFYGRRKAVLINYLNQEQIKKVEFLDGL
jgi:cyclase